MPTTYVNTDFTVYDDETYSGVPAISWEGGSHFLLYGEVSSDNLAFDCWNAGGLLENHGEVLVDSTGFAWGLQSPNWAPLIENFGLWHIKGDYAVGADTYGSSQAVREGAADVSNFGDWIVEGVSGAMGVYLHNGERFINESNFIVSASAGLATGFQSDLWCMIENSGLIQVTGVASEFYPIASIGIAVAALYSQDEPNILNSGTITAQYAILGIENGDITPYFDILNTGTINGIIDLERNGDTLVNEGTINGDVYTYFGNDIVDTRLGTLNGAVALEDGNDTFFAGNAVGSLVSGGIGDDTLTGANKVDEFYGEQGVDNLYGGAGDDLLAGGSAPDTLKGEAGDDWLDGGTGADNLDGGAGVDTLFYDLSAAAVTVNLATGAASGGDAQGDVIANIENLIGSAFNDTLTGSIGTNVLDGDAGADTLRGGAGNDTYYVDNIGDAAIEDVNAGSDTLYSSRSWAVASNIEKVLLTGSGDFNVAGNGLANVIYGNSGDNWINGSFGKDRLFGGGGHDSFIFNRALGPNNIDTITDFSVPADTIRIDNAIFIGIGYAGGLNANYFYAGAAAHDADDRIIYNATTGGLFYDADGSGAGAAVQFAQLSTGLAMTNADFIVI